MFSSLLNLKELSLSGNGLEEIKTSYFQGLDGLVKLDLSHNSLEIARFDMKLFYKVWDLMIINLEQNKDLKEKEFQNI